MDGETDDKSTPPDQPPPAVTPPAADPPAPPVTPPTLDVAAALNNPLIKAEIAKQAKAAADAAAKAATTKAAEEAQKAADRAKMDEVQRLAAEKAESDAELAKARTEAQDASFDRDLYLTLIASKAELADDEALGYLKYQVGKIMKDGSAATVADAITAALAKHTYLLKKTTPPVADQPPKPTIGTPPPKDVSGGPPPAAPAQKSVLEMTKKEYADYKREKGIP